MTVEWEAFLWSLLAITLLLIAALTVVAYLLISRLVRRLSRVTSPSVAAMQQQVSRLQAADPAGSSERALRTLIHREALRCALVGGVTGLAGIVALPVALPLDLYATLRIQAALVQTIAAHYGRAPASEAEVRVRSFLVMSGSRAASEGLAKFLLTVLGKSAAKSVPVLGAVISAAVNYLVAQAIGQAALRAYARRRDA
jgi:hypothetical protein